MTTFKLTLKKKLYINQQWVEPGIPVTVITPGTHVWTTDGKRKIVEAYSRVYGLTIPSSEVSPNTFNVN
ncbi:hypothetical protein [Tenacibaculum piscium]|uniref:hypothetical protein n=1 Tax=Tenacibaculum piscium TaxID=1458515 RepID=UPI001EFB9250|nr:hypothetical protein [Tenacibaculum piscium]MCG8184295.1 hypothetical protein [Tenacibaculum piscium]MCG8205537.1 hypothetical protein [Tenacibaculum piscium]